MTNPNEPASTMTKREMIAAMAMQSIIGKSPCEYHSDRSDGVADSKIRSIAYGAVVYADTLIAELAKEPTK